MTTTALSPTYWFVIKSGPQAGRWHLSGWLESAIKANPIGLNNDGWLKYSVCPRCFAMVLSDEKHAYGNQQWAHEEWHANSDFPRPAS
jgi:hypothetical protein